MLDAACWTPYLHCPGVVKADLPLAFPLCISPTETTACAEEASAQGLWHSLCSMYQGRSGHRPGQYPKHGLTYDSTPGQGATFWSTLPQAVQ
jgi:hypothetical protein